MCACAGHAGVPKVTLPATPPPLPPPRILQVLMFCQMTKMMDIIEDYLWYRKHMYLRLDGSASIADRRSVLLSPASPPPPPCLNRTDT